MLRILSSLFFIAGIILVFLPFKFMLDIGAALLVLAVLLAFLQTRDATAQARRVFGGLFLILAWGIAHIELQALTASTQSRQLADRFLFQAWSLLMGAGEALVITIILFLLTIFISGAYVLALRDAEGITTRQAFISILSLMLNTQYDWMVVADGKVTVTKKKGILKKLGGPGKVVIQPGNAVVFERGGTISRISGAGVVLTQNFEFIREIIDLRRQFHLETIEVVTADKITVNVDAAVIYQILPASETPGGNIITDNMNLYPVTEETLRKAAFTGTAGGWHGFCHGAPLNVVRDQLMSLTLNELFGDEDGDTSHTGLPSTSQEKMRKIINPLLRENDRVIKKVEDAAVAQINAFAPGMGVKIIAVDIRSLELPKAVQDEVAKIRRLKADAQTMKRFEEERNSARRGLIQAVMRIILGIKEDEKILDKPTKEDVTLAIQLIKATGALKTDDVFSRERLEMLEKMAASDGTKIISASGTTPQVETPISTQN